jgi:lysophospholipase L1-like esterase
VFGEKLRFKDNPVKQFFSVLACIGFLFFAGCDKGKHDNSNGAIPVSIVPVNRTDQWWAERHNDKIKNVTAHQKIIFIGDSITHGWEGYGDYTGGIEAWAELNEQYNNQITNLGFLGDQTQHVIWRLENGGIPAGIDPEYVVLMIGTNNVALKHEPEAIAAGIEKIIKIINVNAPAAKIILLSILPRGSGKDDVITARINAVNEIIKKHDGYSGVQYLDIGQYYVNDNGTLKEELFTDRLHLTLAGYTLWKEKLTEVIE